MTPTLDRKYRKMLSTPAPLEGPRKDTIDSLQKQIDFYIAEAHRLRYVQNSHVAISRLPAELLSDVFLYVVETGLERDDTNFAVGTFAFLRVCKRWNEIAVGFPQLWVRWIPGVLKAWHLFKSRSKDAPLFLTWRHYLPEPEPAQNILTDTETPRRIRQLDFNGTREQLKHILGALDSRSTSTTSSIQLHYVHYEKNDNGEHLTRFFSLPFPKLSNLNIDTFLPDPTSSVLTTSNLTSLKLDPPYNDNRRYTQSQLLEVLQHHPNLKQLNLRAGGLPSVENSGELVPIILPCLVDLRLYGMVGTINGFIDLVSMSSPLHNLIIGFQYDDIPSVAAYADTVKKFLTAYYGCKGLAHPRRATYLIVNSSEDQLTIGAKSHSTSTSYPIYNFEFHGIRGALAQKIIHLFPLKHTREYDIERLNFFTDDWRRTLRRMKGLLHLRLYGVDVRPVLNALDLSNVKPNQPIVPKLKSLSFYNVDLLFEPCNKLLDILKERRTHGIGLKSLDIESCRVLTFEYKKKLKGLVKKIAWEDVREIYSEDETETGEDMDSEDEYYGFGYMGF